MYNNIFESAYYELTKEVIGGLTHYYVRFQDGQARHQEIEVSRPVYLEFLRFVRNERNLCRWDEKHKDKYEMTDTKIEDHSLHPQKETEDILIENERDELLRVAINDLSEIQRRRFQLKHEMGLTYEQIAKMESCSRQQVAKSVHLAEKKIKERLSDYKK